MAQQSKNRLAKRNQHCDLTERNRKSQNSPILLWQLLNNGISLQMSFQPKTCTEQHQSKAMINSRVLFQVVAICHLQCAE